MDDLTDPDSSPARVTSRSRRRTMRRGLDIGTLRGLEIGPLADPIVGKAEGDIQYVDSVDSQALRRTYADNVDVDVAAIVEVDAVWGDQTLSGCIDGTRVNYVMASHVAEHVPDLITWLDEVCSVLQPGGQLRLALPDARFSHDVLRAPTRLVDLLAAWIVRARRPQVRDVLDFRLHVAPTADARTLYAGTVDLVEIQPQHSLFAAVEAAGWARDLPDHYFDVHCWVVTPKILARLMEQLAAHGLLHMACAGMVDTAPPIWEFYVFMTPCDDPVLAARSWREIQASLHDPLPGSGAARALADAVQQRLEGAALLEQLAHENAEAAQAVQTLSASLKTISTRLQTVEQSLSWRMTAPLRRLRARWSGSLQRLARSGDPP